MTRAEAIETVAAEFLRRRMEPEWSADDQAMLDRWLEESLAHKVAFWRLEQGWEQAGRALALDAPPAPPSRDARPRAPRWAWPALAASLCAVLLALTFWQLSPRPDPAPAQLATEIGERRTVALADGSTVELNTRSRMRYRVTDTAREVWLDSGEAYFNVAHLTGRPFVVHGGGRKITVLGTRFSIRCDGDRIRVAVEEGRVRIDGPMGDGTAPTATVARGSIAVAQGGSTLVTAQAFERVENALSWRTGRLIFDQMRLSDVAAEFNRYNRVQLDVVGADAAAMRIGGSFEATNVEAFARLLESAYGLRVERRGNRIRISA